MSEDSLQDDEDQLETLTDLHNSLLSRSIFFFNQKEECLLSEIVFQIAVVERFTEKEIENHQQHWLTDNKWDQYN